MLKKRKIVFISLMLLQLIIPFNIINAEEIYYINDNNVELTKEEYDFLSKFYWEGYQDNMTEEDYQEFVDSNIMDGEFQSVERIYYDTTSAMLYSSSHQTSSKLIKMSSSCYTNCTISVVVTWSTVPKVKSYDVIGARLSGISLIKHNQTTAETTTSTNTSTEIQKLSDGFGVSIKIPSSGSDYVISQKYIVSKGGTVYASYQHATSTISLANSKKYTISSSGYGGVFSFTGTAASVYDQMGGVSLTV